MTAAPQIWTAHLEPGEALEWQAKETVMRPTAILPLMGLFVLTPLAIATLKSVTTKDATAILPLTVFAIVIAILLFILGSKGFHPVYYALTDRRALRLATRRGQSDLQSVLRAGAYATANKNNVFIHAQNGKTMRFQMHSFKQSMWLLTQIGTIAPLLSAPK